MGAGLSSAIESLLDGAAPETVAAHVDVAIVGSGYGGSLAALRLAGEGRTVVVLERGSEYAPGDFPVDLGDVPGRVRFQRAGDDDAIGDANALFDFRIGDNVDVLVGSGVGGTSLINANVAVQPDDDIFRHPAWPKELRDDPGSLHPDFDRVRKILGVDDAGDATDGALKYEALDKLAAALNAKCGPAPVAVTFASDGRPVVNAVGVEQSPCARCGNCVTGCNVGAKNTLAMNALPLAAARGARLYNGASVISVMPNSAGDRPEYPWIIRLRRTASEKTPLEDEVFHLAAKKVILAAGSLGSTEILLRSREKHGLKFSGLLGRRFSTNGDAIMFGFGQKDRVNALGERVQQGEHTVGPTITGIARIAIAEGSGPRDTLTLEDGAAPASLRRVFGEMATTGALLHRLTDSHLPAWHSARNDAGLPADPLASSRECMEHSQVLLVMGDDGAAGSLSLSRPKESRFQDPVDHACIAVDWPDAANNRALVAAHRLLAGEDRSVGFDGGQYVPNPFWKPLPDEASSLVPGPGLGGRVITVHPLGGCGMGDDAASGVVDHGGRVFSGELARPGDGAPVHEGLYVLDGAVIPTALGINPFLTIAALSWRAAGSMLRDWHWMESPVARVSNAAVTKVGNRFTGEQPAVQPFQPVEVVFREQLVGKLRHVPKWLTRFHSETARWGGEAGLIVRIEMNTGDLERWLEDPSSRPFRARARVYHNPVSAAEVLKTKMGGIPGEHVSEEDLIADGVGHVHMLTRDRPSLPARLWRALKAMYAYHKRRQSFRARAGSMAADMIRAWFSPADARTEPAPRAGLMTQLRGFLQAAWQQAEYRRFDYEFALKSTSAGSGETITLRGEKILAWTLDRPRVWDALTALPIQIGSGTWRRKATGTLGVDMSHMVTRGMPQVVASPHLPATVEGFARVGALFARALFQTSIWDFGAPEYPSAPIRRALQPRPLRVGRNVVPPEVAEIAVPISGANSKTVRLLLTRYRARPSSGPAKPVLLLHGLAQGSLIYSTETVDENMATAMWKAGYDVWLLDHRLSNLLPEPVPLGGWSIEEIARYDVPIAVERIRADCGGASIRIFAHCVGATAVAMGVLKGWLDSKHLERVAFNAIHPWIMPSAVNDFRAKLGSFFRDVLGSEPLDPIIAPRPSVAQAIVDRLAFSLSRYREEAKDRHPTGGARAIAQAVCDRMSFLYGRMWRHANLDGRTHDAFPDLLGPAPGDVYRHLYYFVRRKRITDRLGRNVFLKEGNLRRHWRFPTLFLHGEKSEVFNPQSATRSAVRLSAVLNGAPQPLGIPVRLKRVPDFGHMDVVFARNAREEVYPLLVRFFGEDSANPPAPDANTGYDRYSEADDVHRHLGFKTSAGPVLRAAWVEQGQVRIRWWAELDDETTSPISGAKLDGAGATLLSERGVRGCEVRYRMLDAAVDSKGPVRFKIGPRVAGAGVGTAGPGPEGASEGCIDYGERLSWLQALRERAANRDAHCLAMRFLVGSCRYPGTPFERDAADAVFAGMMPHIEETEGRPGVGMLFLVGDQIYADATARILDTKVWREKFSERYRDALTTPNLAHVLARVPTHFAVDDHEFSDNWSGLPTRTKGYWRERKREFAFACRAARSFQSSERIPAPLPGAASRAGALWYPLSHRAENALPTFVMDTRSERTLRTEAALPSHRLVSDSQLDALTEWLLAVHRELPDSPKFICCGVGIGPIGREWSPETWRSNDGWLGYPRTLARVAELIVRNRIRNVVFVSGDLHLSSFSRLTFHCNDEAATAWQVVSSGLYSPMPFANAQPGDFSWNQPVEARYPTYVGVDLKVEAESGLLCSGRSHFLRVDAERAAGAWRLVVGAIDRSGGHVTPMGNPPIGAAACADGTWRVML